MHDIILTSSMFDTVKIAEPLGLECLSSVLRQKEYKVKIVEPCIDGLSIEETANRINQEETKVIGISLHRDKNISGIIELIALLRSYKNDYFIIIGGHGPSVGILHNPEVYFSLAQVVDCFILGEGENAILEIMNAVSKDMSWKKIYGIAYWNKTELHVNSPSNKIEDLDSLPLMQRDVLEELVGVYG